MKKYLLFVAFVTVVTKVSAQDYFNPYKMYQANKPIVTGPVGLNFERILATEYNNDTPLHHHIKFNYDEFDQSVKAGSYMDYLQNNYQNKGLNIVDAFSLAYFSLKEGKIGDHSIHHRGNYFIVNDNGNRYLLIIGWSDIQQKMIMILIDGTDKNLLAGIPASLVNSITISHSQIISAAN